MVNRWACCSNLGCPLQLDLLFAHWPQGAVLFAMGVHAEDTGSLDDLTPALVRRLGWVAAAGLIGVVTLVSVQVTLGQLEALLAGRGWPAIVFALLDGLLAVSGTLWLVGWLRRRRTTGETLVARAARASFATYFSYPLVLTIVPVLLAPVALAPELKFVAMAPVGVLASFTVGYALTRVPGISKVL